MFVVNGKKKKIDDGHFKVTGSFVFCCNGFAIAMSESRNERTGFSMKRRYVASKNRRISYQRSWKFDIKVLNGVCKFMKF